jgi:hypothetical protein
MMLLLFKEGIPAVKSLLEQIDGQGVVYINSELLPLTTPARVVPLAIKQSEVWLAKKEYWAIIALAKLLADTQMFPMQAFKEAVSARSEFADWNLRAIEYAEGLP